MQPTVVCLGEALALLPDVPTGEPAPDMARAAGAEVNVALGLAGAETPVAWIGRLGDDALGAVVMSELEGRGVDVGAVEIDPALPTGCYAKTVAIGPDGEPSSRMHYRRAGSAAAGMGPGFLARPAVRERLAAAAFVHVSGITAALSQPCAKLMEALLAAPRNGRAVFDVNWREQMWPSGDPRVVVGLAGLADVVLVGGDEARRVFGTDDPAALRRLLPAPELLIVKDGADRALAAARDGSVVAQPALAVEVLEPVGAGDAFAAGLLTGLVRGEPIERCLRRGHLGAAAVLTVPGDSATPLPAAMLGRLLDSTEREWADVRVSAAGVKEVTR
jgi:2-dehydro-3-deoxygluconokinase